MEEGLEEGMEEHQLIKKELAEIPLGEIQQLRQKVGIKKFDSAFGSQLHKLQRDGEQNFRRANKHRPREMSSKKPVSRFRQVIDIKKKEEKRDPRFDDRCGHLNQDLFSKSFSFLEEIKSRERKQLESEVKKTKDPIEKERLQKILTKMEFHKNNKEKKEQSKALEKEHNKQERQLIIEGKKPFYFSKALHRKVLLAQRYKALKKSGKVEKFISKKRKRNAARDRKRLPAKFKY